MVGEISVDIAPVAGRQGQFARHGSAGTSKEKPVVAPLYFERADPRQNPMATSGSDGRPSHRLTNRPSRCEPYDSRAIIKSKAFNLDAIGELV